MGDPYWRYSASADREAYSGYRTSNATTLSSRPLVSSHIDLSSSPDLLQKDIMGSRLGGGIGARLELGSNGYPPGWEDSYITGRGDVRHGTRSGIPNILDDRPDSLTKADGIVVGGPESSVLFVDALPTDCTQREVSHLFRLFRGFKELRLVHKEPKHSADKAKILCFVEFMDSNQALIALETLQGYKFDNNPDSPALQIRFAQSPFQLLPDETPFPSQPHVSSQPPRTNAHFLSQPPPHSVVYSSELSLDSTHYSSQLPHTSAYYYPSQLPPNSAHSLLRPVPTGVRFPSQLPSSSVRYPSIPSPYRNGPDPVSPRAAYEMNVRSKVNPVVMIKKGGFKKPKATGEGKKINPGLKMKKGGVKKPKAKGEGKKGTGGKSDTKSKEKQVVKIFQKDRQCLCCNEIGHWKRNCPKYLATLKNETSEPSASGEKSDTKSKEKQVVKISQKDQQCHFCKKIGHWKRNCPEYLESLKKKTLESSASGAKVI